MSTRTGTSKRWITKTCGAYRHLKGNDAAAARLADIVTQMKERRVAELRREGAEVYILRPGGVMERGVVTVKAGKFFVANAAEQWQEPFNPETATNVWFTDELEDKDIWAIDGLMPKAPEAELIRKKFDYLDRNATLSKEEYRRLFSGEMKQGTGNCYCIAVLKGIQLWDHGEAVIRTSFRVVRDGPRTAYEVRIPLGDASSPWKRITESDLQSQTVQKEVLVRYVDEGGRTVRTAKEVRDITHRPVSAAVGWQVIEAAYIKHVHMAIEDKFPKEGKVGTRGKITKDGRPDRAAAEGGWSDDTAMDLIAGANRTKVSTRVGFKGPIISPSFHQEGGDSKKKAIEILDGFSNSKDVLICGSLHPNDVAGNRYNIGSEEFLAGHAYLIRSVDKERKQVTLVEPNQTGRPIKISYNDFCRAFRYIAGASVDYTKLFKT